MITEKKIKRDMMELWKETFHDSTRYIDIVFDTYFNPDRVIVRYHENRLIASLLGVPYEFQILATGDKKRILRGLYLCGLATRSEYRRQGIMSEMMLEMERKAMENGFDFTFLIPADTHLREYYKRNGYVDASYRTTERMYEEDESGSDPLHIYSVKDLLETGNLQLQNYLIDWCIEREKEYLYPTIIHSRIDIKAVMAENENSIFLTEKSIDLENSILAKIVAVAFPEIRETEDGGEKVVLAGLYVKAPNATESGADRECKDFTRATNAICRLYSKEWIELLKPYDEMQTKPEGGTRYAMVKYLVANENPSKIENTTCRIFLMLD